MSAQLQRFGSQQNIAQAVFEAASQKDPYIALLYGIEDWEEGDIVSFGLPRNENPMTSTGINLGQFFMSSSSPAFVPPAQCSCPFIAPKGPLTVQVSGAEEYRMDFGGNRYRFKEMIENPADPDGSLIISWEQEPPDPSIVYSKTAELPNPPFDVSVNASGYNYWEAQKGFFEQGKYRGAAKIRINWLDDQTGQVSYQEFFSGQVFDNGQEVPYLKLEQTENFTYEFYYESQEESPEDVEFDPQLASLSFYSWRAQNPTAPATSFVYWTSNEVRIIHQIEVTVTFQAIAQ
jgi:hypothetical protein